MKLVRFFVLLPKMILSYVPVFLPVGMPQFEKFTDDIIELAGPYADPRSMKWAIANMIMHLDSKTWLVPKNYFVRCLRKTAANQVAAHFFNKVKEEQAAAQKAEEDLAKQRAEEAALAVAGQPPAEATASPQVASDEKPKETVQS